MRKPKFARIADETGSSRAWELADPSEFTRRIEDLAEAHARAARWNAQHLTPEERAAEAGFGFRITNRFGHMLLVGVHRLGWVLLRLEPRPMRIVRGSGEAGEPVAFMLPEWTEFHRRELVPAERARVLIDAWLETGEVPLE